MTSADVGCSGRTTGDFRNSVDRRVHLTRDMIDVIIETPANTRTKYKWDAEANAFRAGRVLPLGMSFPFDFGFVPGTKADDGDPIDVLVLADEPLAVGAIVECRVLGAFVVKQSQDVEGKLVRNDRIVAVPTKSVRGASWKTLDDIGADLRDQIADFFKTYVERQGREFELLDTVLPATALKLVREARE
jgi:inorganic pyrophosphatase